MLKTEEICTNSCKRCCFLLAHEVHVEARKLCPTHIHVWAETSKKPPIIGIKKTKIETGKHPESKCRELKKRKVSYQQNHYSRILFAICGAGEKAKAPLPSCPNPLVVDERCSQEGTVPNPWPFLPTDGGIGPEYRNVAWGLEAPRGEEPGGQSQDGRAGKCRWVIGFCQ